MESNIHLYSYGAACLAYLLLSGALLLIWRTRALSVSVIPSTAVTAVWAGTALLSAQTLAAPPAAIQLLEVTRDAVWLSLLFSLYAARVQASGTLFVGRNWLPWFIAGVVLATVAVFTLSELWSALGLSPSLAASLVYCIYLAISLLGLWTLENLYRNSSEIDRAWLKFLCLGLGAMFLFDFLMYANALIAQSQDSAVSLSRGFVVAFSAPFIALAVARSRDRRGMLKFSQHVVFHTFTLMAAGIYLISMAIVHYFIGYLGTSRSEVLQVTYVSASLMLVAAIFLSRRVRARSRVWLSKNFFSYKYDYRLEWLNFTDTLEEGRANMHTPQAIVQAMAALADCDAGVLWGRQTGGHYELLCEWQIRTLNTGDDYSPFQTWLHDTGWVIDVTEWRAQPELYAGLQLPRELEQAPGDWLVVPLMFTQGLEGIIVLRRVPPYSVLNWEDRDLLKVAGRQAASYLAQYQGSLAVTELRQFEAFHRLSAYVAHDLKNILAEQSLIVANAARHRGNQEFFDDVIETVGDSVGRMTRLMAQMHSETRVTELSAVDLSAVLHEAVASHSTTPPVPTLDVPGKPLWVRAQKELLLTVFGHIIKNAKEATAETGAIEVRLKKKSAVAVVEIEDNGVGMSEAFVRDRLFRPFDSTKGLTGMGIGVFESREVLRSLGGSIIVQSSEGAGSLFTIELPLQ